MSVFKTKCFFFLRNPRGGVEDLDRMQAAGFEGVFCNIGDHTPAEWEEIVRPRALQRGMFCGPWARTQNSSGGFEPAVVTRLLECAERWQSPLIVNSESELKGTDDGWTSQIAEMCTGYDAALSMEAQPFANVAWYPLKEMPVLPQIFSDIIDASQAEWYADQWHAYGVDCVFMTYGSYGSSKPTDYKLRAPYSIYTADDCGGDYTLWQPTAFGYEGCVESVLPPTPEDDMQVIGKEDGVVAQYNRLRDLDPDGTLLRKVTDEKGKEVWEDLSALDATPLNKWKAYDKAQRRDQILKDDHDDALS